MFKKSTFVLNYKARDDVEVGEVVSALRVRYGDGFYAHVNKSSKYLAVTIPMYTFEKYDNIKERVIQVL